MAGWLHRNPNIHERTTESSQADVALGPVSEQNLQRKHTADRQGCDAGTCHEIFSHPNYTVAPTARFLEQLQLEWPYVSGATIWEFTAYMDPHGCSERNRADCRRLYVDYARYLSSG